MVYRIGSWRTLVRIEAIKTAMAEVKAEIAENDVFTQVGNVLAHIFGRYERD
jgi:hypothetical protein